MFPAEWRCGSFLLTQEPCTALREQRIGEETCDNFSCATDFVATQRKHVDEFVHLSVASSADKR